MVDSQVSGAGCACIGKIDLTVTGGTPPYFYDWSNGASFEPLTGLCPGTYTATVTDANGNSEVLSVYVPGGNSQMNLSTCVTDVNCNGGFDGSIDLSISGGQPGYTYSWSNGATTQDLNNVTAGTYTTTVTDATGCTATTSATVSQPPALDLISSVYGSDPTNSGGAIDLTVFGGIPPYTYLWSNGVSTQDISNLSPGSYSVTITDANGCTIHNTYTIQGNGGTGTNDILLNGVTTNVACVQSPDCTGAVTLNVTGGNMSNYIFQWSGPNGFTSSDQHLFNICTAGTYCVTVVSANGLVAATGCYTIGQFNSETLEIESSNAAFCNYDQGNSPSICEKVCPHSNVTYFVNPPVNCGQQLPLQGAVWTVSGAESYTVKPNGREVQVQWGEAGPGLITLSGGNASSCFQGSHCITVVEEPEAKFSTDPPVGGNATLQVCKGQSVAFKNESLFGDQYEWIFSDDLTVLTEENPQHTYYTPGNFTVTLIARSNCLCADTMVLPIEVLDTEPPLLDCVGSICPGEVVEYTTSGACSSYTWNVSSNGTVVDGGGINDNSITVEWGQGPVGSISLSALNCNGATCPQASVFSIPIISDNAEIRGNESVCSGSEEDYSIDFFDGTEYIWSVTNGGSILRGQGTNEITIGWTEQASANTTYYVIVDYYNCYLGCGGQDSIPVKILSPFSVQGKVEICEKGNAVFSAKLINPPNLINCDWTIYQQAGPVFWTSPAAANSITFPTNAPPGKYRVFATPAVPGQTCSFEAELVVSVVASPPKPTAISGPDIVCPGNPSTYELMGSLPYSVQWNTTGGNPGSAQGNPINVTWSGNSGSITATYVSVDGLGCKSETETLQVSGISSLSVTGIPTVCQGTVATYTTDFYPNFDYQWEIIPADAGVIKQGQGKNTLEIFWQKPGNHKVRLTVCGVSSDMDVTVFGNPEPAINAPTGLCPGDSAVITTMQPYAAYEWQSASGNLLSNANNIEIPKGSYVIEVTDANGCVGSTEFTIDAFPRPNVSLTTTDPTGFCNNSIFVHMTALVPDGGAFTFQWLFDGNPVGGSGPTYATNQYGQVSVIATNSYGCTAKSAALTLYDHCGGGGYCPIPPNPPCPPGAIQIVPDPTNRCDSMLMVLNDYTGQYVPGSANWWTGISGGALVGNAIGDDVSFVYPNAGKYIVIVAALLSNGSVCDVIDSLDIEAVAQFSQQQACPGDSTIFTDESTRLPDADIVAWTWDFGEAGTTDTSSVPSPGYPYANSGNYTATLTVTAASGCTSSYSENVFVPDQPAPTFALPLANCAGNATEFTLGNPAGILETSWEFGDPTSGDLNEGEGGTVYHNYSPAGMYPVTVHAVNNYGCLGSFTQAVDIVDNPFSGIIVPVNAVICEGKTITLVAPAGPSASYVWSNGTTLQTLVVDKEGIYDVTLTNGNGCTYSPPERIVDVNPAPVGTIKALQLNEFGQVIGVAYPDYAVCHGEDVYLQVQDDGNYNINWSGGNGNNEILIFSDDRNNLLDVGSYTYTVTVTNSNTGCTAVFDPFDVTVNPVPEGFDLTTDDVCAGTPSTISYNGPQPPEWDIFWNTGETGPQMVTDDAGLYFVRVINEFGCSAQSNTVVIFPGPNVGALPAGCHERCNPDTLCLPPLPDIVSWQWYFDGNPIPGATSNQFAATQSGTYYAELLDVNGCQAQSSDLTLDLYDGFGNILGHVWSDVNNNGIIDAADTLVAFIPVQLWQNGSQVNSNITGTGGNFDWFNVPATGYTVQLDTGLLSPIWTVVIGSDSVTLTGCGGKVFADLLIDYECTAQNTSLPMSACAGTSVTYNGSQIMAGDTQDFTFNSYLGCDSIVTVTVMSLATSSSSIAESICPGSTYNYQGVDLSVGDTQDFTLMNYLGCDSVVTVTISALPTSTSSVSLSTCPGTTVQYQRTDLSVGDTQDFILMNFLGCDSVVTVTVSALPTSSSSVSLKTCPGSTVQYQGVDLSVGDTQDFTLTNYLGCDSVVTVTVSALLTSSSSLGLSTCPGTTVQYQGTDLSVGQTQDFTLMNYLGCDSIVTVTVSALPTSTSSLNASTCPGSTYQYQGVDLAVGDTQDFTLTNYLGCDSIVTVTVSAIPTSTSSLAVSTCPGSMYQYQGVDLAVGDTQDFTLVNYLGCDSIVTLTVGALATSTGAESIGVCPNETTVYQGQNLSAGDVQDFVLTNYLGCDSIVTVTVFEKASSAEVLDIQVCPDMFYEYNGTVIQIGEEKDIHFTNSEGCDSLITVRVSAYPSLDFNVTTLNSCPNLANGELSVQVTPGGSMATGYSLDGGMFQTSPVFTDLSAGTYIVFVQDEHSCEFEAPAIVHASEDLKLSLPDALIIPCDSNAITLAPEITGDTTGLQLSWSTGAQSPSISTAEAGTFWVEAGNHCNQTLRREAEVAWAGINGEPIRIYLPNIFAPNAKNPGNDEFRAYFGDNFELLDYRLEVYDRWGNMLFKTEQPEDGWRGSFRDEIMEPGVFVWQVWAKVAFCGRVIEVYRKGDVTVER